MFLTSNFVQSYSFALVLATTLVLTTVSLLVVSVYNLTIHPLSKHPGPWHWSATRFFFARSLAWGNLVHDTHHWHCKYGPIVRLAPNELSFITPGAWKDIYGYRSGHAEFPKNPIWMEKTPNGIFSVINANQKDHARQRRVLNPSFAPRAIHEQEPILQEHINMFIKKLRSMEEQAVNITNWAGYLLFDIGGDLIFGQPFGCMAEGKYHQWVSYLFANLEAATIMSALKFYPFLTSIFLQLIPKRAFQERDYHFQQSSTWIRDRLARKADRQDIIHQIMKNNESFSRMSFGELEASGALLVMAGSETIGTQILVLLTLLLQNPSKLQRVTEEVRHTFHNEHEITIDSMGKPTYFRAAALESLRLGPPVPGQVPRIVPSGGDTIDGAVYPEGTFVSVPQFPAYRSPLNFALPEDFMPERWLPRDGSIKSEVDLSIFDNDKPDALQPFGVGPRACPGKYLAQVQLHLIVCRLLWHFDIEIPENPDHGSQIRKPWEDLRTFSMWEQKPRFIKFTSVRRQPCGL